VINQNDGKLGKRTVSSDELELNVVQWTSGRKGAKCCKPINFSLDLNESEVSENGYLDG
jgi:hypothetical protein